MLFASFAGSYSSITGLSGSSAGKESACNTGDTSLIPGSGRYPGEGIGYQLLYSWTSLVAQTVKKPPAMWETWVWSLGWEDPLGEGMATHSSILAWRIPMDRGAWQAELLLSFWETVLSLVLAVGRYWMLNHRPPSYHEMWDTLHEQAMVWYTNTYRWHAQKNSITNWQWYLWS